MEDIDDPQFDVDSLLARVPGLVGPAVEWLIHQIDRVFGSTSFLTSTFTNEERCKTLVDLVLPLVQAGKAVKDMPESYQPTIPKPRRPRRPNAVSTLVTARLLAEGVPIRYVPRTGPEEKAVRVWLDSNPRGAHASWTNDRSKPLVWAYDGKAYSASGLVNKIWELACWQQAPTAVQGPTRWSVEGGKTLSEMATEWLAAEEETED